MFYEVTFRLLFRYFFIRNFVFVLLYRECYRFDRAFFTFRRFLPYTPSHISQSTTSTTVWENFFYPETFFNLHSFPTFGTTCFYQGFRGSRHFFHEGCRASHWGSKHRSSPYLCLNHIMLSKKYYLVGSIFVLQTQPISLSEPHNVKQKVLLGRFYFCIKVLQNAVSTSSRLWNHSLIATYIARCMSYLLSYRSS